MRHVILGAGGVGGMIGACLARLGEEVTLVVRPETLADHPPKVQFDSPFGSWSVDTAWAAEIPPADLLWLTVKATQLEPAMRSIADTKSDATIVPLLNGIDHIERLRSKFGAERVIPATIAGEMERLSVGHFVHRSPFAVLNVSRRGRSLLQPLSERLRSLGFTCSFVDDETTLMWTKLSFLGPFALATSAFDKPIGEVVAKLSTWEQLERCVRETCMAGRAEGAKLDADVVLPLIKKAPLAMRSSMQKDVEAGRPPELDAIGGAIVRAARRHRLQVPVTEELMAQIERRASTSPRVS